jgi:hypothetical protein
MRSYACSTLTLLAVVAAAAIVGVAHAAEGRTATAAAARPTDTPRTTTTTVAALRPTDEGPTDEVMEAGRWGGWRNKYSSPSYYRPTSYTPTYTTTTTIPDTCVSPVITTGVGTVAASCTGTTTYSRGWNHGYGYKTKHTVKHTNKKQFSSKNTCCDGYLCKSAASVTAKLTGSISPTSELPPYSELPFLTTNVGSCCLPQPDFAITKLLCSSADYDATTGRCAGLILAPIAPGSDTTSISNQVACLCCSGTGTYSGFLNNVDDTSGTAFYTFTCEITAITPVGDVINGACPA